MRRTAVALLPLALLVVACGPASTAEPSARDSTIDPAEVTTRIVGATPEQETVLHEILAGLGRESRVTSVHVKPHRSSAEPPEAVAVDLHMAPGEAVRRDWEMWLAANAFADRSRELQLPRVAELYINGEDFASLDGVGETEEPRDPVDAEALSKAIAAGAKKSGARVDGLELLRPKNFAVVVRLEVDDPAPFLDSRADGFFAGFPWPNAARYDGLLIEVIDPSEEVVFSHATAVSETGGETTWGYIRPALRGCNPIHSIGGPASRPPPPPCPTEAERRQAELQIETVPRSKVTTKIVGGTPKQRAIIEETLAGLGPTRIDSVHIYDKVDDAWFAPPNAVGVDVITSQRDGYTDWQSWRILNAFGRRSLALGLQPIAFAGVKGDRSGGLEWSSDLAEVPVTRKEADEALRQVAETAARHDASMSVRVFKPDRLAFAIVFVTSKPAEFLLRGLKPALQPIRAWETASDGTFVEVLDAKGERVLEESWGVWVRPDLVSCSPYGRFGSPNDPVPPPCPAK